MLALTIAASGFSHPGTSTFTSMVSLAAIRGMPSPLLKCVVCTPIAKELTLLAGDGFRFNPSIVLVIPIALSIPCDSQSIVESLRSLRA